MARDGSKLIKILMIVMVALVLVGVGVLVVSSLARERASLADALAADAIDTEAGPPPRQPEPAIFDAGKIAGKIYADIRAKVDSSVAEPEGGQGSFKLLVMDDPMFLKDKFRVQVRTNSEALKSGYPSGSYRVPPARVGGIGDALDRLKNALPMIDIAYHSSKLTEKDFAVRIEFVGFVNSQAISSYYTYNGNCSSSRVVPECIFEGQARKIMTGEAVTNPVLACLRAMCLCSDKFDALAESDAKIAFVGKVLPDSDGIRDAGIDLEIAGIGEAGSTRREDFMAGFLETSGWVPPAI